MNEAIQAAFLVEKLPTTWQEYKNSLKHKPRHLSLAKLIVIIEKGNISLTNNKKSVDYSNFNLVEGQLQKD